MNTEDLTPRTPALDQHGLLFSGPRPKDPVSARARLTLTGKARTFNFFFLRRAYQELPCPMLLQLHMKEIVLTSTLSYLLTPLHMPMGTSSSKVQKGF